ncbi:MAG: AAA family ATPase [Sphingomonadales bacterium]|jgi:pilus assembly protein CpaE
MNAPSLSMKPLTDLQRSCAAFVNDEQSLQVITNVLNDHGWTSERVVHGGIGQAVKQLAVEASPEFLIIDLGDGREARADINALAEVVEPGTMVLAIGNVNDVTLYRDLLASGLHDYLVKPITEDMVRESILSAEMALSTPSVEVDDPTTHKICGVIGTRGGVGASTLTSSLAWLIAHQLDKRVALLDLDIYFGTDALAFDLEPGRGLIDALENPGRIDSLFIERALIKESENLAILGAEAPITEAMVADATALSHLQSELKTNYDVVMVDLPRSLLPTHGYLLQQMSEILLVVDLSLSAARDTIRILAFLKEFAPDTKVRIVANKVAGTDTGEVSRADFESSIETKIDFILPSDVKNTVMAAKKGKALPQIAGSSKLVGQIRNIANEVVGEDGKSSSGSFWAKVNGLLGSKAAKGAKAK